MNGEQRLCATKILSAIENGKLTTDETIRRLEELVDKELEKPESSMDMQLVDACENLLWELNTNGKLPFVSNLETNKTKVLKRLSREHRQKATLKFIPRLLATTAAVFVAIVFTDGILNYGWFKQYSTEDEQQYVIEGQAYDPGIIEQGIADDMTEPVELTSTSWEQIVDFLGYTPMMPARLPENWEIKDYYAFKSSDVNTVSVFYRKTTDTQATLIFNQDSYHGVEDAYITFEQNAEGELIQINNQRVYVAENMGRLVYEWVDVQNIYTLSGTITCDEANLFVQSVEGVSENE